MSMRLRITSFWLSLRVGLRRFRFIYLPTDLLRSWLRVFFVVAGVGFASIALVGEHYYALAHKGDSTTGLFLLERAQIFPFQYRIRESRAVVLSTSEGIPPDIALKAINGILKDDPFSAQMLYLKVVQKFRIGNRDYRSLVRLNEALPGSQWVSLSVELLR